MRQHYCNVWRNSVETAFKLTKFRGVSGLFCSGCLEAASADILHWTDSQATCQQVTPRHTHVAETRGPAPNTQAGTLGSISDSVLRFLPLVLVSLKQTRSLVSGQWEEQCSLSSSMRVCAEEYHTALSVATRKREKE